MAWCSVKGSTGTTLSYIPLEELYFSKSSYIPNNPALTSDTVTEVSSHEYPAARSFSAVNITTRISAVSASGMYFVTKLPGHHISLALILLEVREQLERNVHIF
jgi:hypothetical protein